MNERPIDAEPVDPGVRLDTREIGDFSYISAERKAVRTTHCWATAIKAFGTL
jgi:hypothetical protein